MIRKFSLAVLDERDKIIDEFNLDIVSDPKGLGYSKEIQTITTPIEEIIVKQIQKLENITLNVNYAFGREYEKAKALRLWLQKNTLKNMAFLWTSPQGRYLADCVDMKFDFSEINQEKVLSIPLTLKSLSPLFELSEQIITIKPGQKGKIYPFTYPYTYGIGLVSNNTIINDYPSDVPLTITLYGEMINIGVSIRERGIATPYASVQFPNASLAEGQYIIIDGRRGTIKLWDGNFFVDFYDNIDPNKQSFLRAKAQAISDLQTDSVRSDKTGYLIATYRRYMQ